MAESAAVVDLGTAANVAEIVGAVAVVGGIAFALVQLNNFQRQRTDAGAIAAFQLWSDVDSLIQLDRVYALPDNAPPETIDADPDTREAVYATYNRLELMGLFVYQRLVRLQYANEWAGGAVRVSWRKLRPWIEAKRKTARSERPGEWFQWLAERLEGLPARDEKVGAHLAHKDWRP